MTPEVQAAFDRFAEAVKGSDVSEAYFLEIIGEFAQDIPAIATSLSFHARDAINELDDDGELTWGEILLEAYRRTFFDPGFTHMYGGYTIPDEKLIEFVDFLSMGFGIDNAMGQVRFIESSIVH